MKVIDSEFGLQWRLKGYYFGFRVTYPVNTKHSVQRGHNVFDGGPTL